MTIEALFEKNIGHRTTAPSISSRRQSIPAEGRPSVMVPDRMDGAILRKSFEIFIQSRIDAIERITCWNERLM